MSFGEHLDELRRRLIVSLLGLAPIVVLAVVFGETILELLLLPVRTELRRAGLPPLLQATGPLETFGAYFRIAIIVSILVGAPWMLWQLWLFVAPGLHAAERRFAYLLAPMSIALTILGILFLYLVILPVSMGFLIRFGATIGRPEVAIAPLPEGVALGSAPLLVFDPPDPEPGAVWVNTTLQELRVSVGERGERGGRGGGGGRGTAVLGVPLSRTQGIAQQYRVSEYVRLVFALGLAFAVGFQTPVVVLLLGWVGIVRREFLVRHRKYALFFMVVAAAVLTPTGDPLTLFLMAAPLYLLFELGIFLLAFLPPGRVARGLWRREGPEAGDE